MFILLSGLVAVPIGFFRGTSTSAEAGLAVWLIVAPSILLYYADIDYQRLWLFLTPIFLFHAGMIAWQVIEKDLARADGLATNANAAAGFLVLGATYVLCKKESNLQGLALPLIAVLLFTGSRLATGAMVAIVLLAAIRGIVGWKAVVAGTILMGLALLAIPEARDAYRLDQDPLDGVNGLWGRIEFSLIPNILPAGFNDPGNPHNVFLKLSLDWGLLAGLVWLGITSYALWLRPRFTGAWYLLLAVLGLSMMDLYVFLGPLGGFWWLLIGQRMKGMSK